MRAGLMRAGAGVHVGAGVLHVGAGVHAGTSAVGTGAGDDDDGFLAAQTFWWLSFALMVEK